MLDQTTRTQAWIAELAAIVAEIDANGMPAPRPTTAKRTRKPKPFWEE
ncbi:hypothetical protein [Sphingomonas sp. Root720]|nr:hypothetical protein [Sphingomonas sp. Root720]